METKSIRVDGDRLWNRLMEIGKIGATPAGGCNRQAMTDEDAAARQLFEDWCIAAGCEMRRDQVGNLFARRPGRNPTSAPVLMGSHLDTQPTGGKFDGVYGVIGGLEVLSTLHDQSITTERPIDLVVWTSEEGCRFPTAMLGSAVWSGALPLHDALNETDRNGLRLEDELIRTAQNGQQLAEPSEVFAAFELHIEQGPVLENRGVPLGVVTGVQNMGRFEVSLSGTPAHAGTTPMELRTDPVRALAAALPALYAATAEIDQEAKITIGSIVTSPGSPNTVPGLVKFTIDVRHPNVALYEQLKKSVRETVEGAASKSNIRASITEVWEAPGVEFAEDCVESVRRAVQTLAYPSIDIVSGAGHDACNVAAVAPTSMIFIPCKNGLSHNEAEHASPEHVEAGCNTLLHAVLDRSMAASD